jgi:hypothetical protein
MLKPISKHNITKSIQNNNPFEILQRTKQTFNYDR